MIALLAPESLVKLKLFVRQVMDASRQSVLIINPRSAISADLEMQSTPTELRASVRASGSHASGSRASGSRASGSRASGSRASGSRASVSRASGSRASGSRASGGNIGRKLEKASSDEESENSDFEAQVSEPEANVAHMLKLLEKRAEELTTRANLLLDTEPSYVITNGQLDDSMVYKCFDISSLHPTMLDPVGRLLPGKLYIGCIAKCCRTSAVTGALIAPPKFKLLCSRRGTVALKSTSAIINSHVHSAQGASKQPRGKAQAASFASAMCRVTSLAQAATAAKKAEVSTDGKPQFAESPSGLSTSHQGPAPSVVLFTLPFEFGNDSSCFIVDVTRTQLEKAETAGQFASEDIVQALSWFEVRLFSRRLDAAGCIAYAQRVVFISVDQFKTIQRRASVHVESSHEHQQELDALIKKLGLTNSSKLDLVCSPVLHKHGGHFAYWFWLPAVKVSFHCDTYPAAGLHAEANRVLNSLASRATGASVPCIRKDASQGIEEQLSGSNVCAFTATDFLGWILNKLATLQCAPEGGKVLNHMACQKELHTALLALTTRASTYESRRRRACADLRQVAVEYAEYRLRPAVASSSAMPQAGKTAGKNKVPQSTCEQEPPKKAKWSEIMSKSESHESSICSSPPSSELELSDSDE